MFESTVIPSASFPGAGKTRTFIIAAALHGILVLAMCIVPLYVPHDTPGVVEQVKIFISSTIPLSSPADSPPQKEPARKAGLPRKGGTHLPVRSQPRKVVREIPWDQSVPHMSEWDFNRTLKGNPSPGSSSMPDGTDFGNFGLPGGRGRGGVVVGNGPGTTGSVPPPVVKQQEKNHEAKVPISSKLLKSKLIKCVKPEYPALAIAARIEGVVILKILVGTDGHVARVAVISGNPVLVVAAQKAVSHWEYSPTVLNGQPMAVEGIVTVRFDLR